MCHDLLVWLKANCRYCYRSLHQTCSWWWTKYERTLVHQTLWMFINTATLLLFSNTPLKEKNQSFCAARLLLFDPSMIYYKLLEGVRGSVSPQCRDRDGAGTSLYQPTPTPHLHLFSTMYTVNTYVCVCVCVYMHACVHACVCAHSPSNSRVFISLNLKLSFDY